MAHKCPSCDADVPGVVTQTDLEDRLNGQRAAKQGEIELLQGQLAASADKAGRFDSVLADRDRLTVELARSTEGASRRDALVALGVHDPAVHSTFGVLFESAVAGLEGDQRPTFDVWLADEATGARVNPVLAPMFRDPTVPDPLSSSTTRPAPAFPPPARDTQPETPGQDPKLPDSGAVRRMLQGMSIGEVKAWQSEHGHKYGWATPPAEG